MSNMCRSVDPMRLFAEVLKTSPIKGKCTSSHVSLAHKSKATTLFKSSSPLRHNEARRTKDKRDSQ